MSSEHVRKASKSFKDLLVWQKAHAMVLAVYRETAEFPPSEQFGVTSQLRRAAASVPANIVEGYRRRSRSEKARFYNIAQASLDEAAYFVLLSKDLNYLKSNELEALMDEVSRLLNAYSAKLRG